MALPKRLNKAPEGLLLFVYSPFLGTMEEKLSCTIFKTLIEEVAKNRILLLVSETRIIYPSGRTNER
jgi:hypothetical protein